jgi:hypothetical protein
VKGRKFTYPVNNINKLNDNIIDIDFIHAHKLTYDIHSRQVIFTGIDNDTLSTIKETKLYYLLMSLSGPLEGAV